MVHHDAADRITVDTDKYRVEVGLLSVGSAEMN